MSSADVYHLGGFEFNGDGDDFDLGGYLSRSPKDLQAMFEQGVRTLGVFTLVEPNCRPRYREAKYEKLRDVKTRRHSHSSRRDTGMHPFTRNHPYNT